MKRRSTTDDERTEPAPAPSRLLRWISIATISMALALVASYWLRRPPAPPVVPPPVPTSTPTTEIVVEMLPTPVPTFPEPLFTPVPKAVPTPVPVSVDLAPFRKDFRTFTPTSLKRLRPLLVEALNGTKGPSHELEVMTAQVYAYLGGREKIKEWIRYAYETSFRARERAPQDPEARKAYLLAILAAGQVKEALPIARDLYSLHSEDPLLAMALGVSLIGTGSAADGLRVLREGSRVFPSSFPLSEALAQALLNREEYAAVEPIARSLLEREPKDPVVSRLLAKALESQKKWAEVVLLYEPLAAARLTDADLRFSLGRAYRMLRQFDAAGKHLDAVLAQTDPPLGADLTAQALLERGKVEFDRERFREAVPFFARAYESNRSDPPTVLYLAGALYRDKQYGEAAAKYAEALKLQPRNLSTERYLGMALLEKGEVAEAEKHLKAVLLGGEEDASLYYHLARIREAAGDRAGAISYLESALRKDPNYQNARVRLDKLTGKGP